MKPNPDDRAPPPATLAGALQNAAADLQQISPPPELQARVMAAAHVGAARPSPAAQSRPAVAAPRSRRARLFADHQVPSGRPVQGTAGNGWWAWSGAVACAAVLAGSAWLMLRVPAPGLVDEGLQFGAVDGGFLPLAPPERWPREATAWLVSTELPGERLAALGLPYDPAHAGDSVRTELLLHPSGEVLAVRFLH